MNQSVHASEGAESPHGRERNGRFARRDFLKLAGAAAGVAAFYPFLGAPASVSAQSPESIRVLIENLELGPADLAQGALTGLRATGRGLGLDAGRGRGDYVSPVLTAKTPFTHVGLHWKADAGAAIDFEVRSSVDGRRWSAWEPVLIEAHTPESAGGETVGALISADRATKLQFRASFGSGNTSPELLETTATLINASDGPTIQSLDGASSVPVLSTGSAQVFSRAGWNADESLRFSNGAEIWRQTFPAVKKLAVHHTATTNNYSTVNGAKAEVRAIYAYHAVTNRWGDIGYNMLIDKWGNVYEGRYGRDATQPREVLSPGVTAGHALYFNYGSSGIAYLGTCTKSGEGSTVGIALPSAARATLVDVLAWECDRHDVSPTASSDYLLINSAWDRNQPNIAGHRDCAGNATICPGGYIYDQLPSLRTDVASRLASQKARNVLSASLTQVPADTIRVGDLNAVSFAWQGSGTSFLYCLEGWRRTGAEDIIYVSGFSGFGSSVNHIEPYPAWQSTTATQASFQALYQAFGNSATAPAPGDRYTFHLVAKDNAGRLSYRAEHTILVIEGGATNSTPAVSISSPANGAVFTSGQSVTFTGSASDAEDGSLSSKLIWTSSRDGQIGSGASFSIATLTVGTHVITASATDSAGATGSATVNIVIEQAPSNGSLTLSAVGYKLRGQQKADLTWTGATTVDVWRRINTGTWSRIAAGVSNQPFTDNINARGGGSYTYRLTANGVTSNEVTVTF